MAIFKGDDDAIGCQVIQPVQGIGGKAGFCLLTITDNGRAGDFSWGYAGALLYITARL